MNWGLSKFFHSTFFSAFVTLIVQLLCIKDKLLIENESARDLIITEQVKPIQLESSQEKKKVLMSTIIRTSQRVKSKFSWVSMLWSVGGTKSWEGSEETTFVKKKFQVLKNAEFRFDILLILYLIWRRWRYLSSSKTMDCLLNYLVVAWTSRTFFIKFFHLFKLDISVLRGRVFLNSIIELLHVTARDCMKAQAFKW